MTEEDSWARFLMQLLTVCSVVAAKERLFILSAVLSCFLVIFTHYLSIIVIGKCLSDKVEDELIRETQ